MVEPQLPPPPLRREGGSGCGASSLEPVAGNSGECDARPPCHRASDDVRLPEQLPAIGAARFDEQYSRATGRADRNCLAIVLDYHADAAGVYHPMRAPLIRRPIRVSEAHTLAGIEDDPAVNAPLNERGRRLLRPADRQVQLRVTA